MKIKEERTLLKKEVTISHSELAKKLGFKNSKIINISRYIDLVDDPEIKIYLEEIE